MIDIGVNLLHPQFDADRGAVLARAEAAGVGMLITATDLQTAADAVRFCESHPGEAVLGCTAGVHPHDASAAPGDLADRLAALAASPHVRAIGETGLDLYRNYSPPDVQRRVFRTQLEVASRVGKPLFVHDRDSGGEVYQALAAVVDRVAGVVVHCFTGNATDLARYLSIGCHIGITGWVTEKKRGAELAGMLHALPLERLLIETDAPFLRPHNVPAAWQAEQAPDASRRRNEPALLPWVAEGVARAMGIAVADVVQHSTENARKLFAAR
ncbi:MAG: TatD family hydrolase [Pseudomonadales bacterium]